MIAILFLLAAETVQINHVPVGEAVAGEPLAVTAEVANAHKLAVFALHFRHKGGSWKSAAFRKDEKGGWAAIIESKEVKPPALEYYLSAQEKGAPEVDRFASESAPHPVLVRVPRDDRTPGSPTATSRARSATATASSISSSTSASAWG